MKSEEIIEKINLTKKRQKIEEKIAKELNVPLEAVQLSSFTMVDKITGKRTLVPFSNIFVPFQD